MRVRTIQDPVLSADGRLAAYAAVPDRGDGEGIVRSTSGEAEASEHRVERGTSPKFSIDGAWVTFEVVPPLAEVEAHRRSKKKSAKDEEEVKEPRPGLELIATSSGERTVFDRVARAAFSSDGRFLAVLHLPSEKDESEEKQGEGTEPTEAEKEEPEPEEAESEPISAAGEGSEGEQTLEKTEAEALPEQGETEAEQAIGDDATDEKDREGGADLVLHELATGRERRIAHVGDFAWNDPTPEDGSSALLAVAIDTPDGRSNRLIVLDLRSDDASVDGTEVQLSPAGGDTTRWETYRALTWARDRDLLAFVSGIEEIDDEGGDPIVRETALRLWDATDGVPPKTLASDTESGEGWRLPAKNELTFSRDGQRLFFGYAVRREDDGARQGSTPDEATADPDDPSTIDDLDPETILEERTVDVWHWDDPFISTHQKERWSEEKERNHLAVVDLESGEVTRLADLELPLVLPTDGEWTLGISDVPYRKAVTWEGAFADLYRVSAWTGERLRVAERLPMSPSRDALSPSGKHVVFFERGGWRLASGAGETRDLTSALETPFADEDWDYPAPPPGYGIAGWVATGEPGAAEDVAVLLYDKYDVWSVGLRGAEAGKTVDAVRLTRGREAERIYRLLDLDEGHRDAEGFWNPGEPVLYRVYDDRAKSDALVAGALLERGSSDPPQLEPLREGPKRFAVVATAEDGNRVLFTEESYTQFPDLWASELDLENGSMSSWRRLSDVNPQLADHDLGEATLVHWRSLDGEPLDGVLIKPAGYQEGERYPVLVYFYRFFSQRLHEFNDPRVNHRPSFPIYASDGYAIFLPDIRFEVGEPGPASLRSLVPGVQHLIDLGIADPERIGLHGHSWSGYQTAFIVTQTDLFAAAVTGAPVSNMTSAYGGIRWGSGLARQFQYEQTQSRIGSTPWEKPQLYVENSPLFFVDRINTPLLIYHGDEDGAVPWYQSIELYLALRRLEKETVFLQYRGEDHHPQAYANKLDWAVKMKEFFDHYLKGEEAPEWWSQGVAYEGK